MYTSPTILFAWLGILVSSCLILAPVSCQDDNMALAGVLMLFTSFGAFVSRLFERRPIG